VNINKLLIKDSAGKPSVTMTAFVTGFITVNFKLLASGITIAGYTMTAFTGGEYAAAVGALGAVYVMRRSGVTDEQKK
jgi:hypothetical protein